jgi:hypothetical protein
VYSKAQSAQKFHQRLNPEGSEQQQHLIKNSMMQGGNS